MSHLFAGATVVLRRVRSGDVCAASSQQTGRDAHVAGADAARALARSSAAARRAARTAAGDLCRRLAHSARVFERALEHRRAQDRRALRPDRSAGHLLPAAARARRGAGARDGLMHSVGRVLPGYEVIRLDGMPTASPGQSGEVLIRGGNVMAGYWQDEAATRAALRDGWLHTGDIGAVRRGRQSLHRRPAQGGDPLRQQHHHPEGGRGRRSCCIRRSPRSR